MFKSFAKGDPSILGFAPERLEPLHRRIQQFVAVGQHAGVSLLLARNGGIADIRRRVSESGIRPSDDS